MNTRKIASEHRLAHWSGLLQERIQSGQSIDEFCTATGISRSTYFYWQHKLREITCERLAEENAPADHALVPSGWTQVAPQASEQIGSVVAIEISGCTIQATAQTDIKLLQSLCQILKTL